MKGDNYKGTILATGAGGEGHLLIAEHATWPRGPSDIPCVRIYVEGFDGGDSVYLTPWEAVAFARMIMEAAQSAWGIDP